MGKYGNSVNIRSLARGSRARKLVTVVSSIALIFGLLVGVQSTAAQAATINVDSYDSLTTAINTAASGDTINITADIVVTKAVSIPNKNLTFEGNGHKISVPNPGVLESGANNPSPSEFKVFGVANNAQVTMQNLTVVGGRAQGACLSNGTGATTRLTGVVLTQGRGGVSGGGGCLYNQGTMYFENSSLIRNSANYGGGALNQGTMYINASSFSENRSESSSGGGGAIEVNNKASLFINNSTFANNQSTEIGGAINNYASNLRIANTTFTGNVAYGGYAGGAIGNNGGKVMVTSSAFAYNYFRNGGSTANPSSYKLDDFGTAGNHVNGSGVTLSYSTYQAAPASATLLNGNHQYVETGATAGATTNPNVPAYFAGGQAMPITNPVTGARMGAAVYRPFLMGDGATSLVPLYVDSWGVDQANQGTKTRYSSAPVMSYLDREGADPEAWLAVGTSSPTTAIGSDSDLVTTDAIGTPRPDGSGGDFPAAGSAELQRDDLVQVTLVVPKNGAVEGASIYGDVYTAGQDVTVKATPAAGYVFGGWKVNGVLCGPDTCGPDYTFQAQAGQNVELEAVFVKGPAQPQAPTAVPKTGTSAEVTVIPSTDVDAKAPTKYVVRAYDSDGNLVDGATCDVLPSDNPLSCDVPGLTTGQTYTFDTVAYAGSDQSAASSKSEPTTLATPDQPATPTVELVDQGEVKITVTPNDEGGTPTSYLVRAYNDLDQQAGSCSITDVAASSLNCTINGLNALSDYYFAVEAINDVGTSPESDATSPMKPGAAPDTPQKPKAKPGPDADEATITANPSDEGTTPDSITISVVDDPSKTCEANAGNNWTCTIDGLDPSGTYEFEAVAENSSGSSDTSQPSGPIALVKPDVPESVIPTIAGPADEDGDYPVNIRVVPADTGGLADQWDVQAYDSGGNIIFGKTCTIVPEDDPLSCTIPAVDPTGDLTFKVVAKNALGSSDESNAVGPVDFTVPDAPVIDSADVTELGEVTVTLQANTTGGTPTEYVVTNTETGKTCRIPAGSNPLSCTIDGLDPVVGYTFVAEAVNQLGASQLSESAGPVTPNVPPKPGGAPTVEVIDDDSVWVYFQPTDGGGTPTSYTALVPNPDSPGDYLNCTVNADAEPLRCQIDGLTPGEGYQVSSYATNGIGDGPSSAATEFETGTPDIPGAPTVEVNEPGTVKITVPENTTGGTPTTYDVYALDENGDRIPDSNYPNGYVTCSITATDDPLSCTIDGLDPTSEYSFEAEATNGSGSSDSSPVVGPITPDDVPATPGISTQVTGDGEVEITFTPGDDGGTVQNYTAYAYEENGDPVINPDTSEQRKCTVSGTGSGPFKCTITGLQPSGDTYKFKGEASNGAGGSEQTEFSNDVVPEGPHSPDSVTPEATAEGEVTVTVEPAADGGTPDEYIVGVYDENGDPVPDPDNPGEDLVCVIKSTDSPLACTIKGLNPDESYTFDAKAKNGAGTSDATDQSGPPITPNVPPATPGKPTVEVVGEGEVDVTVELGDGGATPKWVDIYVLDEAGDRVEDPNDPGQDLKCRVPLPANPIKCSITVPDKTKVYEFEAEAGNDAGPSAPSEESVETIADTPAKPAKPDVKVDEPGTVTVTVNPATEQGGNPSKYKIKRQPASGQGEAECEIEADKNPLSCTFEGLDPAEQYMFTVEAENGAGTSPDSPLSDGVYADVPPNTPTKPTVEVTGDGKIKVKVVPNTGGPTPTHYVFFVAPGIETCNVLVDPEDPEQELSCTIEGLSPADGEYTVEVLAQNGAGDSGRSDASNKVVPTTPNKPDQPTVEATGPGEVEIEVHPVEDGGTPTDYVVRALDENGNQVTDPDGNPVTCTVKATASPVKCKISGLDSKKKYQFESSAQNGAGESDWSEPSDLVDANTPPKAPKGVSGEVSGNGQIEATITPDDSDGSNVDEYTVYALDENGNRIPDGSSPTGFKSCTVAATVSPLKCKISGLDPNKNYELEVEATNEQGSSTPKRNTKKIKPGVPGQPAAPKVKVLGDGKVEIEGTLPSSGGTPSDLVFQAYDENGKAVPGKKCTVKATASPLKCTISGLDPSKEYTFDSQATNGAGGGAKSTKTKKVKPSTGKKDPVIDTIVKGKGTVQTKVTTPKGGVQAKKYVVQAYDSKGKAVKGKTCTASGAKSPTSCTIKGLNPNASYTFVATGKNGKKTVAKSKKSKSTKATTPSKPAVPKVTVEKDGQVRVTLTANKGGGTVTTYKVTAQPGGKSCTVKATAKPLTCVIKGLNKNKSYTFTVTAINGAGKSVSSSRSKAIAASVPTKPNPVRNLKVVARGNKYLNGTYTFMWNSPKASPRKPIDSYLLTLNEYKKTEIFYKKKLKSNKLSYLMTREEIVEAYVEALERKLKVRGELTKSIKVVVTLYAVNSAGMSPEVSDRFTLWVN